MEKRAKIRLLVTIIVVILSLTLFGSLLYVRVITNTKYSMSISNITYEEAEIEIPQLIITSEEESALSAVLELDEVVDAFDAIESGEMQATQPEAELAQAIFDEHIPHIEVIDFTISSQVAVISGQHSDFDYVFTVSIDNTVNKSVSELVYEENESSVVYMNTSNTFFTKSVPTLDIIASIFS